MGGRRLVEGLGLGGAPVEEDDVLPLVLQTDPADVLVHAVGEVQAAEDQTVLHIAQPYEIVLVVGGEGVPLRQGAGALPVLLRANIAKPPCVPLPLTVEGRIGCVDELLLVGDCAGPRRRVAHHVFS